MRVPDEFDYFVSCFWQGSDREANGELDWIRQALALNTPQQRVIIKRFLGELLDRNADVDAILGIDPAAEDENENPQHAHGSGIARARH